MAVKHTSNRNADGNMYGQDANDKNGFYGAAPVVQQVLPAGATTAQIVDFLTLLGLSRKT